MPLPELPSPPPADGLTQDERSLLLYERRRRVWERRLEGKSATDIARSMNLDIRTVYRDLKEATQLIDVTSWLETETSIDLGRLDKLLSVYFPQAVNPQNPNLDFAEFCLKVLARRAKLLGLDAPKRIDIRAMVIEWAEKEGLDPDDVIDVVATLIPHSPDAYGNA